jgi:hypothetical protein
MNELALAPLGLLDCVDVTLKKSPINSLKYEACVAAPVDVLVLLLELLDELFEVVAKADVLVATIPPPNAITIPRDAAPFLIIDFVFMLFLLVVDLHVCF